MTRIDWVTAAALLTILVALLLVGVVSGTPIRHAAQVIPVLTACLVVVLRPSWGRFAAMPVFGFWIFIMVLIWSYLLGLASVVTGHFTPSEIVLTVVIGIACLVGLGATALNPKRSDWWAGLAVFLAFGTLQICAMWLSLQPAVAGR